MILAVCFLLMNLILLNFTPPTFEFYASDYQSIFLCKDFGSYAYSDIVYFTSDQCQGADRDWKQ